MSRKRMLFALAALAVVGLVIAGQALSQDRGRGRGGPEGGPGRGAPDSEQGRQMMEQFRQQASERMREMLGATEEEWKLIQPLMEKVQTLSRQTRGGGMMMMGGGMMGGGFRRGGGTDSQQPPQPPERQQSEVELKTQELVKVLDNKDAPAGDIKTALTALRDAKAKAKAELEAAQKELREVLTVRQEARLVAMGLLD